MNVDRLPDSQPAHAVSGQEVPVSPEKQFETNGREARSGVMASLSKKMPTDSEQTQPSPSLRFLKVTFGVAKDHLINAFSQIKNLKTQDIATSVSKVKQQAKSQIGSLGSGVDQKASRVYEQVKNAFDLGSDLKATAKSATAVVKEDIKFQKQLEKAIQVASKTLKKGEGVEISGEELNNHVFVVIKNRDGKTEVIARQVLLGSGQFAEAYKGVSSTSEKGSALKYAKDAAGEGVEDIEKENANLGILNQGGSHEGVQAMTKLFTVKTLDGQTRTVSKGKLYENGNFQKATFSGKIAHFFGFSIADFHSKTEGEMKNAISTKISNLTTKMKTLEGELKDLEQQAKKLDVNADKEEKIAIDMKVTAKKKEIEKEFMKVVDELNLAGGRVLGKELSGLKEATRDEQKEAARKVCQQFQSDSAELIVNIKLGKVTVSEEVLTRHFENFMLNVAKDCQSEKPVTVKQRAALCSNLVSGLRHIHSQNILHFDIKPDNVFWDHEGAVIADFGGAQKKANIPKRLTTTQGYVSDGYLSAVEHFTKLGKHEDAFTSGVALDQRALGISFYEMIVGGYTPVEGKSDSKEFYDPATYVRMKNDLIKNLQKEAGLSEADATKAATLIAKMAQPIRFEKGHYIPEDAKVPPLEDKDLEDLAGLLKLAA